MAGINMQALMKQAQQMQRKMEKAQDELKSKTVESTVGGGVVKTVFNGAQELLSIEIDQEAVDPEDVETLQDLILTAVNTGLEKSRELAQDEMQGVTGGMKIPGMF
jgi:DNA-binding YbaB/EbfC family protein